MALPGRPPVSVEAERENTPSPLHYIFARRGLKVEQFAKNTDGNRGKIYDS